MFWFLLDKQSKLTLMIVNPERMLLFTLVCNLKLKLLICAEQKKQNIKLQKTFSHTNVILCQKNGDLFPIKPLILTHTGYGKT